MLPFWSHLLLLVIIFTKVLSIKPRSNFRHDIKLPSMVLRSAYPNWKPIINISSKLSSPLILTTLLDKSNGSETARKLARVQGGPFPEDIISYSGFFTVNKTYNSNMYFWFFEAEENPENAPVILWLQGGPGSSSLFGLFEELGPFQLEPDKKTLKRNPWSWHRKHSLLFFDNPIGTGFSYTDDEAGYARNMTQVADDLYEALVQFFKMFNHLQTNDFYITGESFAGKHVPAIAYKIDQANPAAEVAINLKGIAVGNGFTDPYTIFNYSEYLYQLGLIDLSTKEILSRDEKAGRESIENHEYLDAFLCWTTILGIFQYVSRYENLYNFLNEKRFLTAEYAYFVQSPEVRNLLHVGDLEFSSDGNVYHMMVPTFMTSVKPWLEHLLEKYRVLYYSGQMDIIMAYPLSEQLYQSLNWTAKSDYEEALRIPWKVNGQLAGYRKKAGNFQEILVRNAGHMVPTDQPEWAFHLINQFTSDSFANS